MILIVIIICRVFKRRENTGVIRSTETCSDIRNLDIKLSAGRFVIEQGESFGIDGGILTSRIDNGTWYISRDITEKLSEAGQTVTITVPSYFTAQNAVVKLGAGDLLIKGLAAYEMKLNVSAGNMEAVGLYAQKLGIKCGVGRIKADAGMHGDVSVSCGMGDAILRVTNRAEEFNYAASVGLGKVIIGGNEINGNGQTVSDTRAPYNMEIKCGMGNVRVDFGGVA